MQMPRIHVPAALAPAQALDLPAGAARHVQVLRMQPGQTLTLFNGEGGEYAATIERMGRSEVQVRVGEHRPLEREAVHAVHLLVAVMASDRMDWLVEKATELGVASIQPLLTERCALRLKGERADKKQAHWQAVAVAACEQCGRNRVPAILPLQELAPALASLVPGRRALLSLQPQAQAWSQWRASIQPADLPLQFLSGPEGGLSPAEEQLAQADGFAPVTLGARVLRAETAPLVVLGTLQT